MNRREFITVLGGVKMAWPLAAHAQQRVAVPRVGFISAFAESDQQSRVRYVAFVEGLKSLGWIDGRSVRIDHRWGSAGAERMRTDVEELLQLSPNVILTQGSELTITLKNATRTTPIVFIGVSDPLISGLVDRLAHPGGNVTGFTNYDFPIGGKWLEMLKEVAPNVERVIVLFNPENAGQKGLFRAVEAASATLGVRTVVAASTALGSGEIERAMSAFAREPNGGLLVPPGTQALENRDLIVQLAARHRLPAIYADRAYTASGGMMSYDTDASDLFRRAASYVDRILRGEKPGDLPVQGPTKFELVINLKVAKSLGLTVPLPLLARADEVIE